MAGVNFKGDETRDNFRKVPDIDYFIYNNFSENMKKFLRKKCEDFNKKVKTSELENVKKKYLPLMDDKTMKQFIDVCNVYCGLKNEPILCLGRSPKWFLNTALWMKDGIDDYKFVAFSKFWYRHSSDGIKRMDSMAPTKDEIKQEFHNMPLRVFEQMLINENTNECRATYYPHETWTIYQPNRFKTGLLTEKKLEELRKKCPRSMNNFSPAMRDYRNLLNFRILDYLNENGLLRENLNSNSGIKQ